MPSKLECIKKTQKTKEDPYRIPDCHRAPEIIWFTIPYYYYNCLGNLNFGYTLKTTNVFHYLLLIPRELMLQGHMVPELGLHTSHVLSSIVWNTFGLLLEERNQRKLSTFKWNTLQAHLRHFGKCNSYCTVKDILGYSTMIGKRKLKESVLVTHLSILAIKLSKQTVKDEGSSLSLIRQHRRMSYTLWVGNRAWIATVVTYSKVALTTNNFRPFFGIWVVYLWIIFR